MIDQEKLQMLKTGVKAPVLLVDSLKTLTADELAELRYALDVVSPQQQLADVNLEEELMSQYSRIKKLQNDVIDDEVTPANQKAQVANAVASTLQHLVKMQSEYSTAERFKAIEALMIKAMKSLPVEVAAKFIEEYERIDE